MTKKTDMLTADELERLRKNGKEVSKLARKAFGGGPLTPEEIEAEQRGDEWWAKRLAEIREQEKQEP
jgi:hypothetical protein